MAISARKRKKQNTRAGKLRIANHWNAISIIASSQANPLKAVAEFVENSIDARAKQIVIIRGKKKGKFYLKVSDDGDGGSRKGLVVHNFPGLQTDDLLERMIELSLYTEEHLK
jgi:hypothetical protein